MSTDKKLTPKQRGRKGPVRHSRAFFFGGPAICNFEQSSVCGADSYGTCLAGLA